MLIWLRTRLEYAFTLFAMSVFSGAYINLPQLGQSEAELGASNPYNTASMALILAGSLVLAWKQRSAILPLLLKSHLLNAFVVLAAVSALWSFDASVTLRRTAPLLACILLAYYMAARYPMEEVLERLAIASLIMVAASMVVSIGLPSYGRATPSHPGAWNGVFSHKNGFGWALILANLVYAWKFWQPGSRKGAICCLLLLFGFLSVMSQSKTSMIASVVGFAAFPIARMLRAPGILRLWVFFIFGAGGLLCAALLGMFWTEILTGIGRDPTLTGRIPLWTLLLELASERPVLGYGFAAFWLEWNADATMVWQVITWTAPEAHNAYIDMLLQLGVIGLALTLAFLYRVLKLALWDFLTDPQPWTEFVLVYTVLSVLTNMVETMLMRPGDVHCWLLPLVFFALVARERPQEAVAAAQRPVSSSW